jgi:predicted porin
MKRMKKSLIALALVGAFASAAQAAESNYTIYGRLDLGIVKSNVKGDDSVQLNNGTQSRLGFKGVEDLGNGLKGKFQIEHRFNADDGSTRENGADTANGADRFWRGQAWVGLAGEFGEVRLGRQYDAVAGTSDQIDPFGGDYVNSGDGLTVRLADGTVTRVGGSEGLGMGAPAGRRDNSIVYMTPNMNGFSAEAHLQFTETNYEEVGSTSDTNNDKTRNLAYENGPIAASLAYQQTGDTDAALADVDGFHTDGSKMALYFGYTLNNATTFGLGLMEAKEDDAVGIAEAKARYYTLSLTHKVGQGKILAGYQWGGEIDTTSGISFDDDTSDTVYTTEKEKYSKFAVGYHHSMSDRTTLYVNLASEKLKNVGTASGLDADSASIFGFGVKHNF